MFVTIYVLVAHIPVLISVIYAICILNKLERTLKVFSSFLLLSGLIQLVSLWLWYKNVNNLPLLHAYVPLGFACLTWFYALILKGFINPAILYITMGLFLAFSLLNTLFYQGLFKYNSYALTTESVLIVIYALSTFIFMLNGIFKEQKAELVISLNWINSGLFIYYASSLIIFYFGSNLAVYKPTLLVKYAWALHAFFSVVMYSLFIVGLWKRPKT